MRSQDTPWGNGFGDAELTGLTLIRPLRGRSNRDSSDRKLRFACMRLSMVELLRSSFAARRLLQARGCWQLRNSLPCVSKYGEQRGLWQQLVLLWQQVGCCATCFAACRLCMNSLRCAVKLAAELPDHAYPQCKRSAACGHRVPLGENGFGDAELTELTLIRPLRGRPNRDFSCPQASGAQLAVTGHPLGKRLRRCRTDRSDTNSTSPRPSK